jgi:hypothetical protein
MEESIFVNEELKGLEGNEDEHIALHQLHHLGLFLLPHLEQKLLKLLPLPQQEYKQQGLRGRSTPRMECHPTFRRHIHLIGNLNERVTQSSRSAHVSCFTNTLFIALFEPQDVRHTIFGSSWVNAMHEELENFERNQVWTLVEPPRDVNIIGTKWVFKTNNMRMVRL